MNRKGLVLIMAVAGQALVGNSGTLSLRPCADTTLLEVAPTNSNGANSWVNAGTTQNGPSTRGLFRFDLSFIPTNALVRSVELTVSVVGQPVDGLENAAFGLYRMLLSWNEGTNANATNPGQGAPARPGDTTWTYRYYPTNAWAGAGGQPGTDFVAAESSFTYIYGADQSPYTFGTTPELVEDVQRWVGQPSSNYGWMLRCDDEGLPFTARRFGSREDPDNAPVMQADCFVPPAIDGIRYENGKTTLAFQTWPGQSYRVDYRDLLSTNSWLELTNLAPYPEVTRALVDDTAAERQRFYRVASW